MGRMMTLAPYLSLDSPIPIDSYQETILGARARSIGTRGEEDASKAIKTEGHAHPQERKEASWTRNAKWLGLGKPRGRGREHTAPGRENRHPPQGGQGTYHKTISTFQINRQDASKVRETVIDFRLGDIVTQSANIDTAGRTHAASVVGAKKY